MPFRRRAAATSETGSGAGPELSGRRVVSRWARLSRNAFALSGAAVVAALLLLGVLAPVLPLQDPTPVALQTEN